MVKILEPRCIERVLFAEASAGIEKEKIVVGSKCAAQNQGRLAAPKMAPPFHPQIAKVFNLRT